MATRKPAAKSETGKRKASPKPRQSAQTVPVGGVDPELVVKLEQEQLGYAELRKRELSLAIFLDVKKDLSEDDWKVLQQLLLKIQISPVVIAQSCSFPPPETGLPGKRPKPKK